MSNISCFPFPASCFLLHTLLLLAILSPAIAQRMDGELQEEGPTRGRQEYFHDMRAWPFGRIPSMRRLEALDWVSARSKSTQRSLQSQASWRSIGPFDLSGRITAIALHPTDGRTIWAGAAAGGVWKSSDRGESWRPVMDYENAITVGSIAVDPNNPRVVYVGTGEPAFNVDTYAGAGLFKSIDGGESWDLTGLTGVFAFSRVLVHPRDGNIVFASAIHNNSGFYRSSDAGRTWRRIVVDPITDITMNPVNPDEIWIGGGRNGIMRSIDGGLSFVPSASGIASDGTFPGRVSIQVAPSNPSILYALICETTLGAGGEEHLTRIYRSSNSGAHWTMVFDNTPNFLNNPGNPQGEYNNVIAIKPDDPSVVVAGGVYLFRSVDGGATWSEIGLNVHVDYHALVFDPTDPLRLYAGNDGGVYRSDDAGDSFLRQTRGLAITQYYAMAIDHAVPDLTYGGTQDNGTITTEAKEFSYYDPGIVYGSDGFQVIVDPFDRSILYHEIFYGRILRTNVTTRQTIALMDGIDVNERASWFAPLVLDPFDRTTLYTGRKRLYRMRAGDYWRPISDTVAGTMTSIGVSPLDPRVIYMGSMQGDLRVTTDAGVSWRRAASGLPGRGVTDIVPSIRDTLTAWVSFSGFYNEHIYRTTDGGGSWTSIGSAFPDIPVNTLVVDPVNEQVIYAGTDIGVLTTSDGGKSWHELGKGLPRVVVADMEIHRARRVLRAATHGRSMWEIDLGDSIVSPSITTPAGGEKWIGGTTRVVAWNGLSSVESLSLSLDDGATWSLVATNIQGNAFELRVPDTATFTARIRVASWLDSIPPATSRTFTIIPGRPGMGVAFDVKPMQLWGIVHDGSHLWGVSAYRERTLLKIDPRTLATIETIPMALDTGSRNFNGVAWDPVRGTLFINDVTRANPDGTGEAWTLEVRRDGSFVRRFPSPCGYPTGLAWLADSGGGKGRLLASDLAGSQLFYLIDPDNGEVVRSFAPQRILEFGPMGLAPGKEPGSFWQIMDDFSFEYGPRGSAALLMSVDDPNPRCSADLFYTADSTTFFPPFSWGKIVGAGVARDPVDGTLYVVNFEGTVFRVLPCEPGPPAGSPIAPERSAARLHPGTPNPFSTSTDVVVELDRPANGRLMVHDIAGREMIVVVSGTIDAGRNLYTIDANDLPSGVYRLVLALADGTTLATTMVCVR